MVRDPAAKPKLIEAAHGRAAEADARARDVEQRKLISSQTADDYRSRAAALRELAARDVTEL